MATEPQSKTRLAEICNRLGSAESLLSSTQLETDKSVDEFLQAEIALSAAQEALRISCLYQKSSRKKDIFLYENSLFPLLINLAPELGNWASGKGVGLVMGSWVLNLVLNSSFIELSSE